MAKHPLSKREEKRELSRRALIKWSVAAGAALGVSRSKIFDILEKSSGRDTAFAAASNPTHRSVHIVAGNGGLAWFTQFWPFPAVGTANSGTLAWNYPGAQTVVAGTDRKLVIGPDTPFASLPAQNQMTCFLCGNNETHTRQPTSSTSLNGNNIFSVASALQSASPSVIPLITIGDVDVGTAPGAQQPSNVNNGDGIVGLFNSAASRAGGLLANSSDAAVYKSFYDSFTQLNRAANRSTTKIAYTTASGAAQFLGTNLSAKLAITPADLTRYGITGSSPSKLTSVARALIVTVKSFSMGLTNSVVLPAFDDDPHGAFDGGEINTFPAMAKQVFDAFMADLQSTVDANTMVNLSDDTVITVHGDTFKSPQNRGGWPDGTPMNTNVVYVYSAGDLKTGWNGDISAGGNATGFDTSGNPATYNGGTEAKIATAAIAYAIAKRDDRAISTFANGVTISGVFGRVKQI